MAFVPFVESDQPTMAAFNEKFQQNYEAMLANGFQIVTGSYAGTEDGSSAVDFVKDFFCGFKPRFFVLSASSTRIGYGTGDTTLGLVVWVEGVSTVTAGDIGSSTQRTLTFTQSNTGLRMHGQNIKAPHFNKSGQTYYWCAFGRKEE